MYATAKRIFGFIVGVIITVIAFMFLAGSEKGVFNFLVFVGIMILGIVLIYSSLNRDSRAGSDIGEEAIGKIAIEIPGRTLLRFLKKTIDNIWN